MIAALALVIFFVTGALAVDIARKFQIEQKAQDVADAAALAGASALPDSAAAVVASLTYIQQAAGRWYVPPADDIQVLVSADHTAGTVGVLVRGSWDPIIAPVWLMGERTYPVSRFAVAQMALETEVISSFAPGDLNDAPGGRYALFVGKDEQGLESQFGTGGGNQITIVGSAHFNHTAKIDGQNHVLNPGVFEADGINGDPDELSGSRDDDAPYVPAPILDESRLVSDVLLDENDPDQLLYYAEAFQPLLAKNGQPVVMDNGDPVLAMWDGEKWVVTTGNSDVSADNNPGLGAGVDLEVIGDIELELPNSNQAGTQKYWTGSIRVSGTLEFPGNMNNSGLKAVLPANAVDGADNAGVAFHTGYALPENSLAFSNNGNAINIYGLVYAEGALLWDGNTSQAGTMGTAGAYDATGNGFIKGMVYCEDLASSNGGGLVGNNLHIYYDGVMASEIPVTNAEYHSPPRYGTPTVWLTR